MPRSPTPSAKRAVGGRRQRTQQCKLLIAPWALLFVTFAPSTISHRAVKSHKTQQGKSRMATAYGIDPATRYNSVARAFHAVIAVLVIGNLLGGLLADDLPKTWNVIPLHKSMGLLILILSVGRILWRFTWKTPLYRPALKSKELMLAKTVHVTFYALLLIMPLTGWIFSSAGKYGAAFFGIPVSLPIVKDNPLAGLSREGHEILGYAFAALVVLHVAAALRHHYLLKDGVLRRMW